VGLARAAREGCDEGEIAELRRGAAAGAGRKRGERGEAVVGDADARVLGGGVREGGEEEVDFGGVWGELAEDGEGNLGHGLLLVFDN